MKQQCVPGNENGMRTGPLPERPLTEQADILTQKLAGHEIFARMRGKVRGYPLYDLLDRKGTTSPSQSRKVFDRYIADLRVMRQYVTWLRWNGCCQAADELVSALADEAFTMWCEEVPLDAMEPGVVIMFDPQETLRITRVLSKTGGLYLQFLEYFGKEQFIEQYGNELLELLDRYPGISKYNRTNTGELICRTLRTYLIDPILSEVAAQYRSFFDPSKISWSGPTCPLFSFSTPGVNDRKQLCGGAVAYFFRGKKQDEVLSWFPRTVQKKVATWQLDVPLVHYRGVPQLTFGLYDEAEHTQWKKLYPTTASKGVAAHMGVVMSPKNEFTRNEKHILLNSYC